MIRYIRDKGMVPGLWLELEVMGINCPMASQVTRDWFFQRNGRPIIDHCRYQLDFRNKEVRDYATGVIKRLVEEYGVGYIKMDYNIDTGVGTDYHADSAGEGLLSHTRAYLNWLDKIFEMYPDLIIENCSSGGMRMEYSMLSRQSIQSVTDQTNYIKMAAIAANCATACTPVLSAGGRNRGGDDLQHGKRHAVPDSPERLFRADWRAAHAVCAGGDRLL